MKFSFSYNSDILGVDLEVEVVFSEETKGVKKILSLVSGDDPALWLLETVLEDPLREEIAIAAEDHWEENYEDEGPDESDNDHEPDIKPLEDGPRT